MESVSSGETIVFLVGHSVVPLDLYSKATQQRFGCCSACTWFVAFSQPRFSFGSPLVCTAAATNIYNLNPNNCRLSTVAISALSSSEPLRCKLRVRITTPLPPWTKPMRNCASSVNVRPTLPPRRLLPRSNPS